MISAKSASILCLPERPDCLGVCGSFVKEEFERTDDDVRDRLCGAEPSVTFVFVEGVTTGPIGNELVLMKGLEEVAITIFK